MAGHVLFDEGEELMGDTILLEVAVEAERQSVLLPVPG
jgi:hypothetical protein